MMSSVFWSLSFYFSSVIGLVAIILILSSILGEKHMERATGDPYESGIVSDAGASGQFHVNFFLLAVFFVIFDLEAVFIFGWAVALREAGWVGYVEILIFIVVLFCALVYLWRMGGLEISRFARHLVKGNIRSD